MQHGHEKLGPQVADHENTGRFKCGSPARVVKDHRGQASLDMQLMQGTKWLRTPSLAVNPKRWISEVPFGILPPEP
jgi:hypothetical protein